MEGKVKRKPNWNQQESLVLATLVEEHKHVLRGKLCPTLTSHMKTKAWGEVTPDTEVVCDGSRAQQNTCRSREKMAQHFSNSENEISSFRRTVSGTGGSPPPKPLSAIAETVSNVVGESNAVLSGIDHGIDSSMLQLLDNEPIALGIQVTEGPPDTQAHVISTTQDTTATITSYLPSITASQQRPTSQTEYNCSTPRKEELRN